MSGTTSAAGDEAHRWPWRRVTRWCHNWRGLLALWGVFGVLHALGSFGAALGSPDSGAIARSGPPQVASLIAAVISAALADVE
ncbi:MAG: hypothetical protein ACOC9P_01980 [bacterium]